MKNIEIIEEMIKKGIIHDGASSAMKFIGAILDELEQKIIKLEEKIGDMQKNCRNNDESIDAASAIYVSNVVNKINSEITKQQKKKECEHEWSELRSKTSSDGFVAYFELYFICKKCGLKKVVTPV